MSEPVYLSSKELDTIAGKLAGTDGSLDAAVADEYGIDDTEIGRVMDTRDYECGSARRRGRAAIP